MEGPKAARIPVAPIRTQPLPLEFPGVHMMDTEEIEAVERVLRARSPFRYYGLELLKEVESFEAEFAQFVGVAHAVGVTSGTGALHTALAALGVGPGQEVIVPAYMWVSVAAAVVNLGAIPVLADIDDTFCLNPDDVRARITPHTTGIIAVHMSGAPGNIQAIRSLASEKRLFLLEDCAQCAGGVVNGQRVGSFGDIGIFSFQMNKNMTSGEGGAVVTSDSRLYRRAFASHDLGYARDENGRLIFDDEDLMLWGRGYRLDEMRGAILRVQLRKLPKTIEAMRGSKYRIREAIAGLGVGLRRIVDPAGDTGCFLITIYHDGKTAREVNRALRSEGIVTWPQGISNVVIEEGWGLHLYYNIVSLVRRASVDRCGMPWRLAENAQLVHDYAKGACPAADDLFSRSMLLPIPSCLSVKDEEEIIAAFHKVLRAGS